MRYVVSKTYDDTNKPVWYVHKEGFNYVPVFGSIGNKRRANSVCRIMNESEGKIEPRRRNYE